MCRSKAGRTTSQHKDNTQMYSEYALLPSLFECGSECTSKRVEEDNEVLKLNGNLKYSGRKLTNQNRLYRKRN